ncbi:MAG: DNA-binding NtrC family response regulator [Parasphingorhabdus sp.]|jgi:DNA-binding NtrC family response regulator
MPGQFDGFELATRARQCKPELKVLMTSGYTQKHQNLKTANTQSIPLLKKPYTLDDMAQLVRSCLDGD